MERITHINPQRLAWCCADTGVAVDEVVAETGIRADKLQAVLAGDGGLTFLQLRSLAEFFGRSVLFDQATSATRTRSPPTCCCRPGGTFHSAQRRRLSTTV
jgi:hypothetical protein